MSVNQFNSLNRTILSCDQQLAKRVNIGFDDEASNKKDNVITTIPSLLNNKRTQQEAFARMQSELIKMKEKEQERLKDLECIAKKDYGQFNAVKAAQYGVLERLKELIESGEFNPFRLDLNKFDMKNQMENSKQPTLLHWAAFNNRLDVVQYLLSLGLNINVTGGELGEND